MSAESPFDDQDLPLKNVTLTRVLEFHIFPVITRDQYYLHKIFNFRKNTSVVFFSNYLGF